MAFEDLKEQLKDKLQESKAQLEDSPTYNSMKERFETLNPPAQKGIVWAGIVLFSLFMLSCPYSYLSTSSDYVADYESTRDMIRDLLKSSHLANQLGVIPQALNDAQIRSEINRVVVDSRLLPEQNLSIETTDATSFGRSLAPAGVIQEGWVIKLQQLNTRQIVEVGQRLQSMNAGIKLAGMDLKVYEQDPRYYNADFRLIKFSLPIVEEKEDSTARQPRSRRNTDN